MFRYIVRRFYMIPMLLGISSLSFLIMQLAPGILTAMQIIQIFRLKFLRQCGRVFGWISLLTCST